MNDRLIGIGQFEIDHQPRVMSASGIGSCVVVCLYEKETQTGALGHIMLAKNPNFESQPFIIFESQQENDDQENLVKYADTGIDYMVVQLQKIGVDIKKLEAKIVGGAEMFKNITRTDESIGTTNVNAVRQKLSELSIPITSEDVGGNSGRSIRFFLENGQVEIRKRMK